MEPVVILAELICLMPHLKQSWPVTDPKGGRPGDPPRTDQIVLNFMQFL